MLAILLQQWARLYFRNCRLPSYSPDERARTRAFLANGVHTSGLRRVFEALPYMIHVSLFLFFTGLPIYLFNANHVVTIPVVCWVGLSVVTYLTISSMPMIWLGSPYYTPIAHLYWNREKRVEEVVSRSSAEMDNHILSWLVKTLVNDSDQLKLLEYLPGFFRSPLVHSGLLSLTNLDGEILSSVLERFLLRTWNLKSSDLPKWRQIALCVKVADALSLDFVASVIMDDIFPSDKYKLLTSIELGELLRTRDSNTQEEIGLCAQSIVAGIISNVPWDSKGRDERWVALAADQLGKPRDTIRGYGKDSVLLANLTHITRQILRSAQLGGQSRKIAGQSICILPSVSSFDIQNTLLELQDDFLALCAEIVKAQSPKRIRALTEIQGYLSKLRTALTQGTSKLSTASVSIPPSIRLSGHSSHSIDHFEGVHEENTHKSTTTSRPILYPDAGHATHATASPTHFLAPDHSIVVPADESSPGGSPDAKKHIPQGAIRPRSDPESLESRSVSGDAQDTASPASTSFTSPAAPQPTFGLDTNITSTVHPGPSVCDDAQDLSNSTQMKRSHDTRQLGPSQSPTQSPHG